MSNVGSEPALAIGLRHSEILLAEPRHTVPQVDESWSGFADMPAVFATAVMIGFIERTCIEGLRPYLTTEQRTVGTHVDVSHVAATPAGMTITAEVELIGIEGRTLRFRVRCSDEAGLIGEGTHERAIIDFEKFSRRVSQKRAKFDV